MTREEVLAMVPGEESDALIAEKVMGWEKVDEGRMSEPLYTWYHTKDGVRYDVTAKAWTFHPSSNISAAWEVVEKMHQDERWNIAIEFYPDEKEWGADFDELGVTSQGIGKTAPEAICKAALMAVLDL